MAKSLSKNVLRTARDTAKHYNAAKGNVSKAADLAGVSRSTFNSRLLNAQRELPKAFKKFKTSTGGNPAMDKKTMQEAWNAYQSAGLDSAGAARLLGIPSATFHKRLHHYVMAHDVDLAKIRENKPRTLDEDVQYARARESEKVARERLVEAMAELQKLHDTIRDLRWATAAMADHKPATWVLPNRRVHKSEHMPYLLTSDFQVGEVVRKEETEHGYGYDVATFKRRYRRMIETSIYLARQHVGPGWTYPGFIYARGGDPISGGIHKELLETDELTAPEAVKVCAEMESEGIITLAQEFGNVFVPCVGHSNHSRIQVKPQAKKARANSYDMLLDEMIMLKVASMPKIRDRVRFQLTESPDVFFPIYDMQILLTHGDNMGSKGGTGFIGPLATILRGAQKTIAEQSAIGRHVDRLDHGHYHTPAYGGWFLSNGSMPGYGEFAKHFRMRPSPPQQTLLFHHPRRGVVDIKPIILTEA